MTKPNWNTDPKRGISRSRRRCAFQVPTKFRWKQPLFLHFPALSPCFYVSHTRGKLPITKSSAFLLVVGYKCKGASKWENQSANTLDLSASLYPNTKQWNRTCTTKGIQRLSKTAEGLQINVPAIAPAKKRSAPP